MSVLPDGGTERSSASERPRVLVVASTYPAAVDDGTPAFIRDLSMELGQRFETLVLAPSVPGAARSESAPAHRVERFRFFPRRFEDLAAGAMLENVRSKPSRLLQVPFFLVAELIAFRSAVRRFRPDVIHVHWIIPQGVVSRIAGGHTPRLLTTLGGDLYALDSRWMRTVKRWTLRRVGWVTVMNGDMAERVASLGFEPGRISVLPMGVDTQAVSAACTGIESVAGRVVFVGRLVEKKGVAVLLEAVRQLGPDQDVSLTIVGDGPLRTELEAAAAGLDVRFLGQLSRREMLQELALASVAVFPSVPADSGDQDGLPVALLEAMATGRPVVASALPGIDAAIEHGTNGLLVEAGHADGLARMISSVLLDPAGSQQMGVRARRTIEEGFSLAATGNAYGELIDELCRSGTGTGTSRFLRRRAPRVRSHPSQPNPSQDSNE